MQKFFTMNEGFIYARFFQILHKLAKVQGFENEKSYIQTYLPYLIHQWLCLQYSLEEFPFHVAFCDSKHSFYR